MDGWEEAVEERLRDCVTVVCINTISLGMGAVPLDFNFFYGKVK